MSAAAGTFQTREGNPFVTFLVVVLLAVFGGIILNFYLLNEAQEQQRRHLSLITEIQVLSQQIAKFANEAAEGNFEAFEELRATKVRIQNNMNALDSGDQSAGLQALPEDVNEEKYQLINNTWTPIRNEADKILAASDLVTGLADTADQFSADIPLLQARLDEVAKVLADINASPQQIYMASAQLAVADRMLRRGERDSAGWLCSSDRGRWIRSGCGAAGQGPERPAQWQPGTGVDRHPEPRGPGAAGQRVPGLQRYRSERGNASWKPPATCWKSRTLPTSSSWIPSSC